MEQMKSIMRKSKGDQALEQRSWALWLSKHLKLNWRRSCVSKGWTRDLQRSCQTWTSLRLTVVKQSWFPLSQQLCHLQKWPEHMASSDLLMQSQGNQLQVAHAQEEGLSEKGQVSLYPGQQSGHCNGHRQRDRNIPTCSPQGRREINSSPAKGSAEPPQWVKDYCSDCISKQRLLSVYTSDNPESLLKWQK